ncbi:MAG: glycosyltransferase [Selenomonadaceae bacterium]|nr:glycosyltransferase [Selenomonadaceae bacterium]
MAEKEKNFVSAVVYVHNDGKEILNFLDMIRSALEENFLSSEIICVNDASTDDSLEKIKQVSKSATSTNISVVNMTHYHGVELAMNAGVDLAIGDFVFEFDIAAQDFPAETVMQVYRRSLQGYDIVSASPSGKRETSSKLFYWLFNKFNSESLIMDTERFRILSRRAINRVTSMNKAVPYRKAVYAASGFKMDSIKYEPSEKIKILRSQEENEYRERLAIDALLLFTDVGYSLTMSLTKVMMLITAIAGVYATLIYIMGSPVAGWTTTMIFLSFAFFCLFGILTVVVKYLQLILNLIFKRKRYNFEGIEKLTAR